MGGSHLLKAHLRHVAAHAVELVDSERESLSQLISHRLPLDEIGRAFEVAADKAAGAVKVSVQP